MKAVQTVLIALISTWSRSSRNGCGLIRHPEQPVRLGRGELDVRLDLPGQEFRDLGTSFEAVSAQLSAVRAKAMPGASTDFESVMENLEDAVALFSPEGELMFSNAAMRALLPVLVARSGSAGSAKPALSLLAENDIRQLVERAPRAQVSRPSPSPGHLVRGDWRPPNLLLCHAIDDAKGRHQGDGRSRTWCTEPGARRSTIRKQALGRLMAAWRTSQGSAERRDGSPRAPEASSDHARADTVPANVGRTKTLGDQARQRDRRRSNGSTRWWGFPVRKARRAEAAARAPVVARGRVCDDGAGGRREHVVKTECPPIVPEINADPGMLQQALLNLINACHRCRTGGRGPLPPLAPAGRDPTRHRRGIPPEI
jgi:hypothetical protein